MPTDAQDNGPRCQVIARRLAGRALSMAVDGSAHRPRAGEARVSMLLARRAARGLLGDTAGDRCDAGPTPAQALRRLGTQAAEAGGVLPRLADGVGHRRGVYGPLCLHLLLSAVAQAGGGGEVRREVQVLAGCLSQAGEVGGAVGVDVALWHAVARLECAMLLDAPDAGAAALQAIGAAVSVSGRGGALHPQSPDDTPDAWVYRELTGLHALYLAAQIAGDPSWAARCAQAAVYHLGHTQPDYTTYQPWGLACFSADVETAVFAEQQLHDVQTHLSIEGPGGALLPGLLLADAAAAMDGTIASVWSPYRFTEDE